MGQCIAICFMGDTHHDAADLRILDANDKPVPYELRVLHGEPWRTLSDHLPVEATFET